MPHTNAKTRRDLHAQITSDLIAAIETGPGDFMLPWQRSASALSLPTNALTRKAYSGINILGLWAAAARAQFVQPIWATYQQWKQLGAHVRRGERSSTILFYREFPTAATPADQDDTGIRRVARASAVFNASQVDGFVTPTTTSLDPVRPVEQQQRLDMFIAGTGADIRHVGDAAFYHRKDDYIALPAPDAFIGSSTSTATEAYYATALHELAHWTGAPHRLAREFGTRFGDDAYALEELVAEIASAFLCAEHGISSTPRPDHAAYLSHWLKVMRSDNRAIFVAAAKASEAGRYLNDLQGAAKR